MILLLWTMGCIGFAADGFLPLWPNGAPGSEGKTGAEAVRIATGDERVVSNVHNPSIMPYLPPKGAGLGAALVIAPGGGHRELWTTHEGHNLAKFLASNGIASFVLHYRLAREKDSTYKIEVESLADTLRAIRVVRSHAAEWGINPARVGVMGFSAGGELAALAAMWGKEGVTSATDPIDRLSSRPSFQALIYPAIPKELKLSKDSPPAFLACGEDDRQNISQGLPELYLAMKKAGMSAELHVYAGVGHGFGMRTRNTGAVAGWPFRFFEWLDGRGFLKKN